MNLEHQKLAVKLVEKYGSQAKAAKAIGLNQSTLSLIISGKNENLTLRTVIKLKKG